MRARDPDGGEGQRCPEGHIRKLFIVVLNKADPIHRLKAKLFGKGFERF